MSDEFVVSGLHHIQLAMPRGREEEAREFYGGVLDFEEIAKPEHLRSRGGCWFQLEEIQFHLGVDDPFVPAKKAHPALTVHNLDALQRRLEASGIEIVWDTHLEGHRRFYVSDCFENRLELIERVPIQGAG